MKINSLRYRFAFIISIVAAVLLALIVWLSVVMSNQVTKSQIATKEEVFGTFLHDITRNALLQGEYEMLQIYLEKLLQDPDITQIRAADSRGIIVASTTPIELGESLPPSPPEFAGNINRRTITNETGLVGAVEIHFSHQAVNQEQQQMIQATVMAAVIGLTLVIGISLLLGFLLTRRLTILTEAAQRLSQGDLSAQVETEAVPYDEVGLLAKVFNTMARRLESMVSELKAVNFTLEERVKERTVQLEATNQELEKARDYAESANLAKGNFLANMSHEIRTPMNAVIGMTHLALQTEMTAQQREYLRKVSFAAESLLGIINDILDFSKIEAGRLEMEEREFFIDETIEKVASIVSGKMIEKKLEFLLKTDPEIPPSLLGDSLRLSQVLINLCNNAAKFTEKGEVILTSKLIGRDEERAELLFSVSDTGIGISDKAIKRLFRPFSQADISTTRKYGGTGLGLAISKELVELMGGKFMVKSELGKGSEFSFTASFGIGSLEKREKMSLGAELKGRRILIVDDNQNAREIFASQLSSLNFKVESVASGKEAIEELLRAEAYGISYDLIIMDWIMPDLDGFETVKQIRKDKRIKHQSRIIIATAYGGDDTPTRAENEGLDGFITKPSNMSTLFDGIMSAFGKESKRSKRLQEQASSLSQNKMDMEGARVLLVEDNEFNREVAGELLSSDGMQVTSAENGAVAMKLLESFRPDIILMDIQMPVMDGYETTKNIRQRSDIAEIPIIAMTAHAMRSDRERCLAAGMDDYITKPIAPEKLSKLLAKWLAKTGKLSPEASQAALPPEAPEPAETAEMILPESIEGIDMEKGLSFCNNKPEFYRKMLQNFREGRRSSYREIIDELNKGEIASAHRLAHSTKSIAGTIGATALYDAAYALEICLNRKENPEQALQLFGKELKTLLQELDKHPELRIEKAKTKEQSLDKERCLLVMQEVSALLDSDLAGAMEKLSPLENCLGKSPLAPQLNELKQAISVFDIDKAQDVIGIISKGMADKGDKA